jgi:putative Mg2+ transporter-C (MgtC) family protein
MGFIGGGVILKLSQDREIRGVTTAASIWVTAAIGISVGLGQAWLAVICAVVVWFILVVLGYFEKKHLSTDDHSKM